jgi:alpha-tubulin suppressor-like RCC1 family protein
VLSNGVYCSGDNAAGQLGLPSYCTTTSCSQVTYANGRNTLSTGKIAGSFTYNHIGSAVVSAGATTCFRAADGTVKCWGLNTAGQVGDGSRTNRLIATPVTNSIGGDVVQVASGTSHNCALKYDGTVWCWGNYNGVSSSVPALVPSLTGVVQLAAGYQFACALFSNGTAQCWGANYYGYLGNGTTTATNSPVSAGYNNGTQIVLLDSSPATYLPMELSALSANTNQACGLYKGIPVCWGQTGSAGTPGYYVYPTAYQNLLCAFGRRA